MAFRRSYQKIESGTIKRRAILLTAMVFVLAFFLQTWMGSWLTPQKNKGNEIIVQFLSDSTYLVDSDTTNYDQFASTLKEAVIKAKKKHKENYITIVIPKTQKVGAVADIVLVSNGMDLKIELMMEP